MKQTVKARVLTISTEIALCLGVSMSVTVRVRALAEHPSLGHAARRGRTTPRAAGIVMKE
jgi:hypothetical protein